MRARSTPRAAPIRVPSTSRPTMVPAQWVPSPEVSPLPDPEKSCCTRGHRGTPDAKRRSRSRSPPPSRPVLSRGTDAQGPPRCPMSRHRKPGRLGGRIANPAVRWAGSPFRGQPPPPPSRTRAPGRSRAESSASSMTGAGCSGPRERSRRMAQRSGMRPPPCGWRSLPRRLRGRGVASPTPRRPGRSARDDAGGRAGPPRTRSTGA